MQTLPAPSHCSGQGPPHRLRSSWAPLPGVCSVAPMGFRGTPMWMRQRRRRCCGHWGLGAASRTTDNKELSFADQVPMPWAQPTHTVASQPFDEAKFADENAGDRPHI